MKRILTQSPLREAYIKQLEELSKNEDPAVRMSVALDYNTPIGILTELSNDTFSGVRRSIARNYYTPAEVLAKLAKDKVAYVREAVASNENTPDETLAELAKDADESISVTAQVCASYKAYKTGKIK